MMHSYSTTVLRAGGLLGLVLTVFWSKEGGDRLVAQRPATGSSVRDAREIGARLLTYHPDALDQASEAGLKDALTTYEQAGHTVWLIGSTRTSLTEQKIQEGLAKAEVLYEQAAQQMTKAMTLVPGLVRLAGVPSRKVERDIVIPFGTGVLPVAGELTPGRLPRFQWRQVDLSRGDKLEVDVSATSDFICVLELIRPPLGTSSFRVQLTGGSEVLADIRLSVTVPPKIPVHVEIREPAGPTEATVGLYSSHKRLLVPATALDFSSAGYSYETANFREHGNAKFWPGGEGFTHCFVVKGGFVIDLPAGEYHLIVSKGPEYLPVDRSIQVPSGGSAAFKVDLRRWINMADRGWHSGDTHVHFARPDQTANQRLALWAQAEDLHVVNVLRMGDARETYFEQYAFGRPGRYLYGGGALIPGQEDPRTGVLGHTISLNLLHPIRDPQHRYYLYSTTFDEARRQGGLSGYAHASRDAFLVHRDMTLNIPRNKADFAEICEFGKVGTDLYYEFLNLGFKLTATGGSDVPWGGTVGDSRVYAYTGGALDPDQWFAAVRRGRTFVTTGPMLEFSINDRLPGDHLTPAPGEPLQIHARASRGPTAVSIGRLEIVANGEVLRSTEASGNSAVLDFALPAQRSMWIAARTTGAHTTPIYVTVDGKRHWNRKLVPELLQKRLHTLNEIDSLIDQNGATIGLGRQPEWENPESFREGRAELRRMVQEARDVYQRLESEAQTGR